MARGRKVSLSKAPKDVDPAALAEKGETTGPQKRRLGGLEFLSLRNVDDKPQPGTWDVYDKMSRNPTIALARMVATAPMLAAEIVTDADEDVSEDASALVDDLNKNLWPEFVSWARQALDYGFQSFEVIWTQNESGQFVPERLKPLSVRKTEILVDDDHGNFAGLQQGSKRDGDLVVLPPEKCVLYSYNAQPGNLYGTSRHENCRETAWKTWSNLMDRLGLYTDRVAGATPLVEYPDGETTDASGARRSNFDIARAIIDGLARARGIAMPGVCLNGVDIAGMLRTGGKLGDFRQWHIDFLESKDQHGQEFKELLTYCDQLLMRAWLVPERTATEAQKGGSRADSESHGDIALTVALQVLDDILLAWNRQIIDRVLTYNFGKSAKGTARTKKVAFDQVQQTFYQQFVQTVLSQPPNIDLLLKAVDLPQLIEEAGLPVVANATLTPEDVRGPEPTEDAPPASLSLAREAYRRMSLGDFNEAEHPRDEGGKFAEGGTSHQTGGLWQKGQRSLYEKNGTLVFHSPKGETQIGPDLLNFTPVQISETSKVDAPIAEALRKQGENPSEWSFWGGKVYPTAAVNAAKEWHENKLGTSKDNTAKQLPGLDELRDAEAKRNANIEEHKRTSEKHWRNEEQGRIVPIAPELEKNLRALQEKYPRAALFMQAEAQESSTHWSDPVGKAAAAKNAKHILLKGGTTQDAAAALKARQSSV